MLFFDKCSPHVRKIWAKRVLNEGKPLLKADDRANSRLSGDDHRGASEWVPVSALRHLANPPRSLHRCAIANQQSRLLDGERRSVRVMLSSKATARLQMRQPSATTYLLAL